MFLRTFAPMGVYETLFRFLDATSVYMGTPGTHPWAQGFPLTTQLPGGPEPLTQVDFDSDDLKYPQATGNAELLDAITHYYNHFYDAGITQKNVCVFAGGRPGIAAIFAFLRPEIQVLIEETEYTPYWDMLRLFNRKHTLVPSNPDNKFAPELTEYNTALADAKPALIIKSNPCNPTGVTWRGEQLKDLVQFCSGSDRGAIIDEAYEFFNAKGAESSLQHIQDINATNIFVVGAATKGLQAPGLRIGWVVASEEHIELFRNWSSIAMGGVSRLSQICAARLLEIKRVTQARNAVQSFFDQQRKRYREGLEQAGIELFTGDGGFYHWGRLPDGLSAMELNERLFKFKAAILPGVYCDMARRGQQSPLNDYIRFSFGPIPAEDYDSDMQILHESLEPATTVS